MAPRARGRKQGQTKGQLWHGYRRPIVRDGAFWLALVLTVVALAAQNAWSGLDDGLAWGLFAADVVVTALITFALLGVLAGTVRGFGEGWRSGERVIGRATPAPTPGPTKPDPVPDTERPVIGLELEKKARALGRAIGATQRKSRKP